MNTISTMHVLRVRVMGLTPLSTIFQLYRDDQFYWSGEQEYPEKTTDRSLISDEIPSETDPKKKRHVTFFGSWWEGEGVKRKASTFI
jgi:hypothetical protein